MQTLHRYIEIFFRVCISLSFAFAFYLVRSTKLRLASFTRCFAGKRVFDSLLGDSDRVSRADRKSVV